MATYLYCVLAPPRTEAFPASLEGVAGAPVRALVSDGAGLEAWVATIDDGKLGMSGRALVSEALTHNEVVEAALATGRTPLPARFGSCFADDEACLADLDRRRQALVAMLSRVAGAVEMSVLLVPTNPVRANLAKPPRRDEPDAGRRYLEAVRERTRVLDQRRSDSDDMVARITRSVAAMVRGEAHTAAPSGLVSIAHLVRVGDVETYRRAVAEIKKVGDFRVVVAGPRAPYTFIEEVPPLDRHDSGSPNRDA